MDRFAAQLASLNGIITISNTAAHLAGALGVPTVVLIDDKFHTPWPVTGDKTPWYPNVRIVHRKQRPWSTVLQEANQQRETFAKAGGAS